MTAPYANLDALLADVAHVEPVPVPAAYRTPPMARFCHPCPRCNYERQGSQPWVALGLYTVEGLERHLAEVHGEGG